MASGKHPKSVTVLHDKGRLSPEDPEFSLAGTGDLF